MSRYKWLIFVGLAALTEVACNTAVPDRSVAPTPVTPTVAATPVTDTAPSTPPPREAPASAGLVAGAAADWTVVKRQYVEAIDRYRLTVMLDGKELTFDASRVCYEVAVPGEVLPETIPSARGYDIVCQVDVR